MHTMIERPLLPAESGLPGMRTIHAIAVGWGRWRILDASGRAIGHVTTDDAIDGVRYRAQRFHAPTRAFRDVGTFWSAQDAISALRHSR